MNAAQQAPSVLARYFIAGERNAKIWSEATLPVWSDDGTRFSYQIMTPTGPQYRLVDVAAAALKPLFDPDALLAALPKADNDEAPTVDTLEAVGLTRDGQAISFSHGGRRWEAPLDTLEPVDLGPAAGSGELLSPDGEERLMVSDHDLWLLDENGIRRRLTDDGDGDRSYGEFVGFMSVVSLQQAVLPPLPVAIWSPDSKRIAVCHVDTRAALPMPLVQAVPPEGVRPRLHVYPFPMPGDEHGARFDLLFIDRRGGQVRAKIDGLESFAFDPLAAGNGWWEDDGRHFLLRNASRDGQHADLWRIDTETGNTTLLVSDDTPGAGRPLMIGEPVAAHPLTDGRVVWASEVDGWRHLYLVNPADGSWEQVTAGPWRVQAIQHVDECARRIFFTGQGREPGIDPYYAQVYGIDFDGSNLRRLTPEDLAHDLLVAPRTSRPAGRAGPSAFSPCGRWFVDSAGAVDQPATSVLRARNGEMVMLLETGDGSEAWPRDMPLPEAFFVKALDGETDLWGALYRPAGFDATRRYPVVEIVYGGPQMAVTPRTFRQSIKAPTAEMLAALGFVTVIIDGPGTPQRSREFWFRSHGHLESCGGLDDHIAAIKSLAAERPWMDLSRGVGITGFSGGGYATVRAMGTFPDFYSVGVAICGNHDQAAYVAGWGEMFHGPYDRARYATQANTEIAGAITGKLLLIHGEMDDNVHPAHTLRVADALIAADRDFDLLIVPNADHGVARHPYAARRTHDFFLRHLPPVASETGRVA